MSEIDSLFCLSCGEHHETGGEALACDHERGIERPEMSLGQLHRASNVRGCPWCAAEREALEDRDA